MTKTEFRRQKGPVTRPVSILVSQQPEGNMHTLYRRRIRFAVVCRYHAHQRDGSEEGMTAIGVVKYVFWAGQNRPALAEPTRIRTLAARGA